MLSIAELVTIIIAVCSAVGSITTMAIYVSKIKWSQETMDKEFDKKLVKVSKLEEEVRELSETGAGPVVSLGTRVFDLEKEVRQLKETGAGPVASLNRRLDAQEEKIDRLLEKISELNSDVRVVVATMQKGSRN
jgi:biopolymer transport protein ExbB/TolQ